MRDSLLRLRVPLAVLLLVVSGFQTLLRLVWIAMSTGDGGFVRAVAGQYDYISSWTLTVVVTLVVGLCRLVVPPLAAARRLAIAAAVLVGLQVALTTLFALITLVLDDNGGAFAVFRLLTCFAELALMVGLLVVLVRLVGAPESRRALADGGADHPSGVDAEPGNSWSPQVANQTAPTPGSQISGWQPPPNAGAVWGSAHQAASGVSASGWGGAPDQSGGWTPQGRQPSDQHHEAPQTQGPSQNQRPTQNQGTQRPGPGEEQQHTRIVDSRQWGRDAGSDHSPGQGRP